MPSEQEIIRDEKGRFVKGHSGNPGGRPIDTLTRTAREILKEVTESGKTRQELFVRKTLDDAFKGDPVSKKLIWNYLEGMPTQKVLTKDLDELKDLSDDELRQIFEQRNNGGADKEGSE